MKSILFAMATSALALGTQAAVADQTTATPIKAVQQVFTGSWEYTAGKEVAMTAVLKDQGNAAMLTVNGVNFTFPLVGQLRCLGCMGVFADTFDYKNETVRFTLWTDGKSNTIDMEKFDYNPELMIAGIIKPVSVAADVSVTSMVSQDGNKALMAIEDSVYVLNRIATLRCLGCLGQFADVAKLADADKANINVTLWNGLGPKGAFMDVEALNYEKLLNNANTYAGRLEYKPMDFYSFIGYMTNDGEQVELRLGTGTYKLNKVGQPKCLGCMGEFADVASIADLAKAKIIVTLWNSFDVVSNDMIKEIRFEKFTAKIK